MENTTAARTDASLYLLGLGLFLALVPKTNIGQFLIFGAFGLIPAVIVGIIIWFGWTLVRDRTTTRTTTTQQSPSDVHVEYDDEHFTPDTDEFHEHGLYDYMVDMENR